MILKINKKIIKLIKKTLMQMLILLIIMEKLIKELNIDKIIKDIPPASNQ